MTIRYVLLGLTLMGLAAGCGEPEHVRQSSVAGVTLADLRPTITDSPLPVMLFLITTYQVELSLLDNIHYCCENLPQEIIAFQDPKAFEANGFFAACGTGMMTGPVSACLLRMGATELGQTSLVLDAGAEISFTEALIDNKTIAYHSTDGDLQTITLQNGVLGWTLTARPDPKTPRRVHIRVLPVFTPQAAMHWPGVERFAEKMAHRFVASRFDVSLGEADFVVLGIKRDGDEKLTSLERLLFSPPAREDQVRLYVIMCAKASEVRQ